MLFADRGVAQPGSAPEWGSGGRAFESLRPDHLLSVKPPIRAVPQGLGALAAALTVALTHSGLRPSVYLRGTIKSGTLRNPAFTYT